MIQGTPTLSGFYTTTNLPIQASFLNGTQPWATKVEALANIPIGTRHPYMTIVIVDEIYLCTQDMTDFVSLRSLLLQDASDVPVEDTDENFAAENVEDALAELFEAIQNFKSNYKIELAAGESVIERLAGAYVLPDGWTMTHNGPTGGNLLISHNLGTKRIVTISVKATDENGTRVLVPFRDAYSGILENGTDLLIEGLAQNNLPLQIELIFN